MLPSGPSRNLIAMSDQAEAKRRAALVPFDLSRHWAVIGLLYVAGYVVLDWISLIEPYAPFGISAWNLGNGLSFALVLLSGRRTIPLLLVAELMTDLVHQTLLPWYVELTGSLLISSGYGAALLVISSDPVSSTYHGSSV